ncbi:ribosomal protein S6 [Polytolypa hystricis UAMH7299]|uniref:Small ribosomal subunit protein bS6m n=1 Tax=Polytolypa hystricis (strain UAMH7299) TaxID=1447883 RepID=A0A2B7XQ19_POLH7|nr:ribosomal protein S6 [Polytolypa hystricis UAMH7299]
MLYELIAIVRPGSLSEVRDIARTAGTQILRSGGVVRGMTNWGPFRLPKPTTKHQSRYTVGHHFIMRFDSSSAAQASVKRTLGLDPRMIRFGIVKLGNTLDDIKEVPGSVEWNDTKSREVQVGGGSGNNSGRTGMASFAGLI